MKPSVVSRALIVVLAATSATATQYALDRDLNSYIVLGIRVARVQSMFTEPPGCNVGVDCGPTVQRYGGCGYFHSDGGRFAAPGQVVANQVCGTKSFFEVFSNVSPCTDNMCSQVADAGSSPFCEEPWTPPLFGDLDGDGQPSCDADCVTDPDDVARACGVTLPFPPCDPTRPIVATRNEDCSSDDALPGNHRCDLAPGTYGAVRISKGARLTFAPGTTVVCSLNARSATRISSSGPATVLVPGAGSVYFNNSADVGGDCGTFRIASEHGLVKLGRYGDYGIDACTIGGLLKLGHANNLHGHFIGDSVGSDIHNDGRCCASTITLPFPTTTTTEPGSTSTTTTTHPGGSTTTTTRTTTTTLTLPTTTTLAPGAFTRTPGFYKNHPDVTQGILTAAGGLTVCGHPITDCDVNHGHSALEALCVAVDGEQRLQLIRHLVTASLTRGAGGATFSGYATCDAVCRDAGASTDALAACIDAADEFNQSGDRIAAPFDGGPANPTPCKFAFATACNLLDPTTCAVP
jgi:hypothetical protein